MRRNFLLAVGALLVVLACSTKHQLSMENAMVEKNILKIWGEELVEKKTKFTVRTNMQNLTGKPIIILLGEIQCFRGDVQGFVEHSFAGIGERTINFTANQMKKFNFLCDFHGREVPSGEFRLVITNVYDNPSNDSRTPGKPIAKNVTWRILSGGNGGEKHSGAHENGHKAHEEAKQTGKKAANANAKKKQ